LINRYLDGNRVSPFLRWLAIGFVALGGWGLTGFLVLGMGCLIRGTLDPFEQIWTDSGKLVIIAQFVSVVFAANVLYGSAIQAACSGDRQESEVC
jgi:hypothetical protein